MVDKLRAGEAVLVIVVAGRGIVGPRKPLDILRRQVAHLGQKIGELHNQVPISLMAKLSRTSGNESVGVSPGHFHYGGTAADRARLLRPSGGEDHPGGGRRPLLHRALVLVAAAPGGDGKPDRRLEEAHDGLERIEPDRVRFTEFASSGEERRLDFLEHRRNGDSELAEWDGLLGSVQATDGSRLAFGPVALAGR